MSQNVEAIRETHQAYLRQDIEAMLGHLDEQIVWKVPDTLPWGGTYTSREDVAGFFALLLEYFDQYELHPQELLAAADRVVDIGILRGRCKLNGEPFEIRYCMIWKMRDGTAVEMEEFSDTAALVIAAQAEATSSSG
jgi:ketosteroid isomerase-like protein